MDLIFKIAVIGILISILNALLEQCGRKEMALMSTIMGLVVVLLMVAKEIAGLLEVVKDLFRI